MRSTMAAIRERTRLQTTRLPCPPKSAHKAILPNQHKTTTHLPLLKVLASLSTRIAPTSRLEIFPLLSVLPALNQDTQPPHPNMLLLKATTLNTHHHRSLRPHTAALQLKHNLQRFLLVRPVPLPHRPFLSVVHLHLPLLLIAVPIRRVRVHLPWYQREWVPVPLNPLSRTLRSPKPPPLMRLPREVFHCLLADSHRPQRLQLHRIILPPAPRLPPPPMPFLFCDHLPRLPSHLHHHRASAPLRFKATAARFLEMDLRTPLRPHLPPHPPRLPSPNYHP